jgi:hypothetical protein
LLITVYWVDDLSFSSSSEWKWNSRALAGRLNRPNRLSSANDSNATNKETGGWIASEDDKAPWWETNFKEQVNGVAQEFLAEIKGIYTQGLSGYKGRPDWKLWTKKFTVAYQAPGAEDGEFTPIVDNDGNTKVFNANWDKDTAVSHTFPYPISIENFCISIIINYWSEFTVFSTRCLICHCEFLRP